MEGVIECTALGRRGRCWGANFCTQPVLVGSGVGRHAGDIGSSKRQGLGIPNIGPQHLQCWLGAVLARGVVMEGVIE